MELNKKILLTILLIIFLLLFNIVALRKVNGLKRHNEKLTKNIDNIKENENMLLKIFDDFILYDNIKINDVYLINSDNKKTKLSELVILEKMILYTPKVSCNSCSSREIDIINNFFSKEQKEKIIFISNFTNIRSLKLFEEQSGIRTFDCNLMSILSNQELNNNSLIFVLSNSMYGYCFYFSDKYDINYMIEYYKLMNKRFDIR